MLRKRKPSEPTPAAHDAGRRESVVQLQERIVSEHGILSPETQDAAVRYIHENHDDFDGVLTLARAAAQTLREKDGETDTSRERIIYEALSSQRDPERLDRLTRALLHETRQSFYTPLPEVLVRYMETHLERHPWDKTIRDFIVKDIPRAQREYARHYGKYPENPFQGVKRIVGALKRVPSLYHALRAYASVFDDFAFRPGWRAFAEQLREDYPDDLTSATALLAMVVSNMDTGWQPTEVYSAFRGLHDKSGDALVDEVIRACDSFLLPIPSVLGLGIGEYGTSDALAIVRRVAHWLQRVQPENAGYEQRRYSSGERFLRNLAQTPVGAAAYMAFLVETPDASWRAKLLNNLHDSTTRITKSRDASVSIAAGIVDMYRRGLIPPQSDVETDAQTLLAMTLLDEGASYFVDTSAFSHTPDDAPNGARPLMAYLATTPLGANGQYDSEASGRLIREILRRTDWIDAILSDFDRALTIPEGKRIVDGWLLSALAAYPDHAPHVCERIKERLKTAANLDNKVTVACAFGHLCHRLHERTLGDEWVLPRRRAVARKLNLSLPPIISRAEEVRNAIKDYIRDIHYERTLSDAEYEDLQEMLLELETAISHMATNALYNLTMGTDTASSLAWLLREPLMLLDQSAFHHQMAEQQALEIQRRLCAGANP